jgi:signal transduction histidine kinase
MARPTPPPGIRATKRIRLAREREWHQRLREFATRSARRLTSPLNVASALEALSQDTQAFLGAQTTSIWLHDREARELVLAGSAPAERRGGVARIPVEDRVAAAARGLRLDRPQLLTDLADPVVVAPLRGWRRALGTLVVDGPHLIDLDDEQRIYFVSEVASQLSVVVENLQLLEQTLAQRRLLENTLNSLVDLVIVSDNDLRIVETNDAFAARLRLRRRELVGRRVEELIDPAVFQWISPGDAPGGGGDQNLEGPRTYEGPLLGGTFVITMTPLVAEAGDPVGRVIVARDISLQARLEAERETLRERLAQSEKLASLGQFVAGIAHEMNNPLQGVLGHLELMIRKPKGVLPVRSELRRVYQDARRAATIVRNLLVFSGRRRVVRRRIAIRRLLTRVLTSRRAALARARIQVVRREAENLSPVVGDPVLLHEAFLNVLINAEHAIRDAGGEGTIEIDTAVSADGNAVVTTIRDSGAGIPKDVLPRVFDPFFTTKEVGQGTGLGLAITYGVLQDHGGSIRAANAVNRGAIFTLELPANSGDRRHRPPRKGGRGSDQRSSTANHELENREAALESDKVPSNER